MTIGEMLRCVDREATLAALDALYDEDQRDAYERVWDNLLSLQPAATTMICQLSRAWLVGDPPQFYVGISGVENGSNAYYAIEYTRWEEWLSMPVVVTPELSHLMPHEVLAHILWELTWSGFDQTDIQERLDKIVELVEEVTLDAERPTLN